MVIIRKYKPIGHIDEEGNTSFCEGGCDEGDKTEAEMEEVDCNMECDICGKDPFGGANTYYIIDGKNNSYQMCKDCFNKLRDLLKSDKNFEDSEKEWLEDFKKNHRCGICRLLLAKEISRSGHEYWICSHCGSVYTPDGKKDYIHTKWSQDDFAWEKDITRR